MQIKLSYNESVALGLEKHAQKVSQVRTFFGQRGSLDAYVRIFGAKTSDFS